MGGCQPRPNALLCSFCWIGRGHIHVYTYICILYIQWPSAQSATVPGSLDRWMIRLWCFGLGGCFRCASPRRRALCFKPMRCHCWGLGEMLSFFCWEVCAPRPRIDPRNVTKSSPHPLKIDENRTPRHPRDWRDGPRGTPGEHLGEEGLPWEVHGSQDLKKLDKGVSRTLPGTPLREQF